MENPRCPEAVPPTPVPGLDLRMWFAGCALANANVVTSSDSDVAVKQAIEAADKLISALRTRVPTKASMKAPTARQMKKWEDKLARQEGAADRQTAPALKKMPGRYAVIPDPESE